MAYKGVPSLHNYSPKDYPKAGKIWDIESAPNGVVYMATDNGLLEFDGEDWNIYSGSQGITRSLCVIDDSTFFTGSDLDFGIWKKQKQHLYYTSLYPFKQNVQNGIEEFWHCYSLKDGIVFISAQSIFVYHNEQLTKIPAPSRILNCFPSGDSLFIVDKENGLLSFNNLSLREVEYQIDAKTNAVFIGLFENNNELFFVSDNNGVYNYSKKGIKIVESPLSNYLKKAKVFSFERITNQYIAIGTVMKGLVIADVNGNIVHLINRFKGLQNNTILSLHYAPNGKLWAGLDHGLTSLFLHDPFTYFYDFRGDFGSGYTAHLLGENFYLGTNQGLYFSSWDKLDDKFPYYSFEHIPQTDGQVWSLYSTNDYLLIGHDKGLFQYKNKQLEVIDSRSGVWSIQRAGEYLLTGTYDGINVYHKQNQQWMFLKKMDSIIGSCTQLIFQDERHLWVNIPNYAIIRVEIDTNFNASSRELIMPYDSLHKQLLIQQLGDSIYLKSNDIYLSLHSLDTIKLSAMNPLNILPEGAFTSINPKKINTQFYFYPIHNGFAFKNENHIFSELNVLKAPMIKAASAFDSRESLLFNDDADIRFKFNNIKLRFLCSNCEDIFYQYRLNDRGDWSEYTANSEVNYYDLPFGSYTFEVRAIQGDKVSDSAQISFKIQRPFYLSWIAFGLYAISFVFLIILVQQRKKQILRNQARILKEKERKRLNKISLEHKQTIQRIEQERLELLNQQLKEQLRGKTVELANKAKENEAKNKLLSEVKEKFIQMKDRPKITKQQIKELIRVLDNNISDNDQTFEIQMDELHQEFFKKLKTAHPSLSSNDLRICAYLKVGLNSKEIAEIMNIQLSSSYISRSRIRKKLELAADENLYDFLNSI
jgi:AraC family chitin signaling transcriptional activator